MIKIFVYLFQVYNSNVFIWMEKYVQLPKIKRKIWRKKIMSRTTGARGCELVTSFEQFYL